MLLWEEESCTSMRVEWTKWTSYMLARRRKGTGDGGRTGDWGLRSWNWAGSGGGLGPAEGLAAASGSDLRPYAGIYFIHLFIGHRILRWQRTARKRIGHVHVFGDGDGDGDLQLEQCTRFGARSDIYILG